MNYQSELLASIVLELEAPRGFTCVNVCCDIMEILINCRVVTVYSYY